MFTSQNLVRSFTKNDTASSALRIAIGVALISVLAQIYIPMHPVAITLHTVGVILVAVLYSPFEAFATLAAYIIIGMIGAPVFGNFGSGLAKLSGPAGGYYLGMLVAAIVVPNVRDALKIDLKSSIQVGFLALLTLAFIYFFGILILSRFVGLQNAIYSGFIVFIPSGIVKTVILAEILSRINAKTN